MTLTFKHRFEEQFPEPRNSVEWVAEENLWDLIDELADEPPRLSAPILALAASEQREEAR